MCREPKVTRWSKGAAPNKRKEELGHTGQHYSRERGGGFAKAAGARRLIIPAVMLSRLLAAPRKTLGAVLDRLHRDLGAFPPDDLQFFVFKLVSCDEKLLKLLLNRLREVPDVANRLLRVRAPGHSEQAVVPLGIPFALLLDLKNADDAAGQHDARESRRIVKARRELPPGKRTCSGRKTEAGRTVGCLSKK